MNIEALIEIARALVVGGKRLPAMDESAPIRNKRFVRLRIPQPVEARSDYREWTMIISCFGESFRILSQIPLRQ